jgi:glycosyltransferase involved in cell wall biosynthesis
VHVLKMCEAMSALGHKVTLYHCTPPGADPEATFACYGIRHRFGLEHLASRPGIWRHLFGLQAALRVRRRRSGRDLVFSRFLPAGAWAALAGVPTIQELHVPADTASGSLYLRLLLGGRGFRKLVVITRALEDEIQRMVPQRQWADILVEADGVNLEEYAAAATLPVPADIAPFTAQRPLAGYVGSLYPGKGAEMILPIASRLPAVRFLVVGGPEEIAAEYRRRSIKQGLTNITWLGQRDNAEVPRYLLACDVLLLPNQQKVLVLGRQDIGRWTSPLKMFEYMAAGKVIVASNLPVLTEVLSADNAVLCAPDDPVQWAEAIGRIVAAPESYHPLAERARRDVELHDWQHRAARCIAAACAVPR